ncbi:BCL2 modifying factor 2 [Lepisosteus oculatus]|uniref:Bcl2 modifying factor n=1 Tax=Lepisosteus oculatus TaxID=7918 RepID=W5N4P7_LEPOC|nr:PREDICTED: bcl-2-modifying factor [Lepisosteus oculatus]XP_015206406.1 PREDICTED: bcl-2-modifying factor [Lepisosteus oculatus]
MEEDEDDVFHPSHFSHCWGTQFREIKYEDKGTQTPSPALVHGDNMLPCGVGAEPRRLFYGNAAFRLHFPAHFEQGGDEEEETGEAEEQPVRSAEVRIGQKLQRIGDQFHRDYLHMYRRNQRNHQPMWWRLALALFTFLFERQGNRNQLRGDQR